MSKPLIDPAWTEEHKRYCRKQFVRKDPSVLLERIEELERRISKLESKTKK